MRKEVGWMVFIKDGSRTVISAHAKFRHRWEWLKKVSWLYGYPEVWFVLDGKPFQKKRVLSTAITSVEDGPKHEVDLFVKQPWWRPWTLDAAGCTGYPQEDFKI